MMFSDPYTAFEVTLIPTRDILVSLDGWHLTERVMVIVEFMYSLGLAGVATKPKLSKD